MLSHLFARVFGRSSLAEKQLLGYCRGDTDMAARLIDHEMARAPRLSRSAAAQAAIERWDRDRR